VTAPTLAGTLRWMEILVALAVVQSTLELLVVRRAFADDGTWRWASLSREMPLLAPLLRYRPFVALLIMRLIAALLLLAGMRGAVAPILWITSLLVNVRFRGTTNGGSDMMVMVVLAGLAVAHLFPDSILVVHAAVLYVAAQTFMSYFIAGIAKLGSAAWRDGSAMAAFLRTPHFAVPARLVALLDSAPRRRTASCGVIGFECAAPLALLQPLACATYTLVAFAFHVGNAWAFGLNRFVLAWGAAWPALLYASSLMA